MQISQRSHPTVILPYRVKATSYKKITAIHHDTGWIFGKILYRISCGKTYVIKFVRKWALSYGIYK